MRTKQILSVLLVFAVLFAVMSLSVQAENEPGIPETPLLRYSFVSYCTDDFYIVNGTAYVNIKYYGINNVTTRAEVSIKLQHQFLFWWFDVSGGEWFDTVYGVNGEVNHSLALSSGGNFRAVINVKVYGQGTGYDEINDNPTASN